MAPVQPAARSSEVPADLAAELALAERCAELARETVYPHFRQVLQVNTKADASPVTVADRLAEQEMRRLISRSFPHHGILGEEEGPTGRTEAELTATEWLWVLDPIDGTRAFVTGRPTFCTLISLFHRGVPVLGVIDQPITRERWIGVRGQPTRYVAELPGRPGTRQSVTLEMAELSCTAPEIIRPERQADFRRLAGRVNRVSWGGDAYAYGLLALGQIDLIAEDTLKPWDWGALVPVIEGAGGTITDWQGRPLSLQSDGSVLASANSPLACEARALLNISRS
ncbi:inositol monophosphatase family protein [Oecophyllibacter saccharovorans]|uniref:inositol monophosphatase family protein n=1 Tax=Oecophyllibacter saccharovorans TaxID=2558360 RepID=UPI0011446705|nr:inositol monophosphatase family protein [Oecophyllibacter saccharovorans]QDH15750.1 inositol monophosphatase family protein [Oecophyllibacter saccharovorans]